MRTVYHFGVDPCDGWQEIMLPPDAKILHIGTNREGLRMWVQLDKDAPTFLTRYAVLGTGWKVPENAEHVSTEIAPTGFVWHLFRESLGEA